MSNRRVNCRIVVANWYNINIFKQTITMVGIIWHIGMHGHLGYCIRLGDLRNPDSKQHIYDIYCEIHDMYANGFRRICRSWNSDTIYATLEHSS